VLALDNMIGADQSTGSSFGDAADVSRSGRAAMDTVVNGTGRGVAAVAPSIGAPRQVSVIWSNACILSWTGLRAC
jgi:hypothetical protein